VNPIVKKLADQAGSTHKQSLGVYQFYTHELEEFVELLIRECVQTLIDNTPARYTNESAEEDWDKGYDRAMRDCVHHIKEHFGVKE
jgi:hypothetical protein